MAHVILFHSALGLRPGVHSFAEQLRKAGHTVTTPDFYNGEVHRRISCDKNTRELRIVYC